MLLKSCYTGLGILFLVLFTPILCRRNKSTALNIESKIVGGTAVPIEKFPYMAQLFNAENLCAGSIISSWAVMTAAHCFDTNQDSHEMEIHYDGPLSTRGLMMTNLHFVPLHKCSQLHNLTMSKDMFCLYGNGKYDTCKGDSGGGVLWKGMIVGIVSHGDGCAQKNKPSVYCNVWLFRSWIKRKLFEFQHEFCERSIIDGIRLMNKTIISRRCKQTINV